MIKIIIYATFGMLCLLVLWGFMNATSYFELALAAVFYFVVSYLSFKIIFRDGAQQPVVELVDSGSQTVVQRNRAHVLERTVTTDIEKRAFLKLIGGVGISFFLVSLVNRRFAGLIPGASTFSAATPAPTSTPAQNPLVGYKISEVADGVIAYYGFTGNDGGWYIMREDTNTGSFRYAKGASDYTGNWANRESLKYDYFNNVF